MNSIKRKQRTPLQPISAIRKEKFCLEDVSTDGKYSLIYLLEKADPIHSEVSFFVYTNVKGGKHMQYTIPILKTERLLLRPITQQDIEAMFVYTSQENVARYVTWHAHTSVEDTKAFLMLILSGYEQGNHLLWGIEYSGTLIGTIDFVTIDHTHKLGEIGYVLSEDYWNKGLTTEATKKLIDFGFKELKLVRIQARCLEENISSQKVMEKSGMQFEGLLRKSMFIKGQYKNVKMYAITDDDARKPS